MKPIFIIEHLEPKLWAWCVIEYKHMSRIVGRGNIWFTNIAKKYSRKLEKYGTVFTKSVKDMNLENICVLDPAAENILMPIDEKKFQYFIFGGILGDYPPRKRTKEELTRFLKNSATRNIGKEQLSTDGAVFVVHEILNGKKFSELKFQKGVDVRINSVESTHLPFKYVLKNGKPLMSKELIKYLKTH